jgi:hypothetical protein
LGSGAVAAQNIKTMDGRKHPRKWWLALGATVLIGFGAPAQHHPIWLSGNEVLHFDPEEPGPITKTALPQPTEPSIPASHRYAGEVAQRTQHVEYDENGDILFFMIDGRIYDRNGYMIVDSGSDPGDRDCRQCFFGGQEAYAYPLPGSCSKFIVFSLFAAIGGSGTSEPPGLVLEEQSFMRAGILDMTLLNDDPEYEDLDCLVRGRLMTRDERNAEGLVGLLDFADLDFIVGDGISPSGSYLEQGAYSSDGVDNQLVRSALLQVQDDESALLAVRGEEELYLFWVNGSGIGFVPGASGFQNPYDLVVNGLGDQDLTFRGEMALAQTGNEIRLAFSSYWNYPFSVIANGLVYMRFQLSNGPNGPQLALVSGGTPNPNPSVYVLDVHDPSERPFNSAGDPILRPVTGGLEFSPNAAYLYFVKSGQGTSAAPTTNFGYIDLAVPCQPGNCPAYNYPVTEDPLLARRLADSQLVLNKGPYSLETALYMVSKDENGDHWLTYFSSPDAPQTGLWELEHIALSAVSSRTAADGSTTYRYLDRSVTGSRRYDKIRTEQCCEEVVMMNDRSKPVTPTSQLWSPGNNPFCDADGPIYIATDLIIPSGANVQANNLEFRFGEDARLIIHRGGRLSAYNTTFTSACERWPGIRVEGNTTNYYQFDNPALHQELEQGQLVLDYSTVENAHVGVWCTRERPDGTADQAFNGGFVRAYYSTFKDCITGVDIQPYRRYDLPVPLTHTQLPNRCLFAGCQFKTTADWPGGQPKAMGVLNRVKHVRFVNCSFANEAPELFTALEAGAGLLLSSALVYVDGSGNPEQSFFKNLTVGVQNAAGPFNPVRVKKMHFAQNRLGIFDVGSFNGEYAENTFDLSDLDADPDYSIGMYLWESKEFIVEENTFSATVQGNAVGIYFYGQQAGPKGSAPEDWTYYDERIYNNSFTNLYAGNVVDGIHRGDASSQVDDGLQLLCGDYTGNFMDIGLNARSLVRPNQGTVVQSLVQNELAGNRYFTADCDNADIPDWVFDDLWNDVESNMSLVIDYKRHEEPDLIVDVDCPDVEDLNDIPVPQSGEFSKVDHCANGVYPIVQEGLNGRREAYRQAKTLLTGAINAYDGTVDLGQTPNLIEAIQQHNPSLSSAYLRDLLLSKHPLSDEVLGLVIGREDPMDPWHLTQVLLQNSPLSPGIWRTVEEDEVLAPFFLAMVAQAQQGAGPTVKQVLEQEVAHRRSELATHQRVLGTIYARDTTGTPLDSLTALVLYDKDPENAARRLEALIHLGQYSLAQDLLSTTMANHLGKEVLQDILGMHQSTAGEWELLGEGDRTTLQDHAGGGRTGAAWAAGILYSIDAEVPQPPVRFPDTNKRLLPRPGGASAAAAQAPTLACYPNPTNASTFVTYPSYLDGSTMTILDSKGDLVRNITLVGGGVLEMGTGQLPDGLYLVNIAGTTFSTKLTVQH